MQPALFRDVIPNGANGPVRDPTSFSTLNRSERDHQSWRATTLLGFSSELVSFSPSIILDAPQRATRSPGDQPKNGAPNQHHCERQYPDSAGALLKNRDEDRGQKAKNADSQDKQPDLDSG